MRRQKRISCYLPSVCRSGDGVSPLGEHRLQGSRIATIIASSSTISDESECSQGFPTRQKQLADNPSTYGLIGVQPSLGDVTGATRVVDGDTLVVDGVVIRLDGIDAPETDLPK